MRLFAFQRAHVAVLDIAGRKAKQVANELVSDGLQAASWECGAADEVGVAEAVHSLAASRGRLAVAVTSRGELRLPRGPGLGVRLVRETVERLAVPFDDAPPARARETRTTSESTAAT